MSSFGELSEAIAALNRAMVQSENLHQTLERIAEIARSSINGCESVGVTMRTDDHPETAAYAGASAKPLDQAQYGEDDGPCLHAYRTNTPVLVEDLDAVAPQWPSFVRTARSLGIRNSLSLPLLIDDEAVGALNLYASVGGTFHGDVAEYAQLLASQAAVALTNAAIYWRTHELTENLNAALESRDIIGQAKGVIMTQLGLTAQEAFELLRKVSQHRNVKLRELAEHVAMTGEVPST